ncbi:unnamed protein product [Tilletia controversa]|uniref:Tudor domain-containing protein n=3 Tax=Tilletia TaxID=13289 RepID=A0A8X7MVF0_9BASI|nr:hypothetical protein CF336_g2559 [Tilletia laevis]KAE8202147.1 hypothetical protein CF328_g2386 [Tilletia controversa]KAE8262976.1 hypothetical protein A4X03_0g2035 [Tilletia caries]KAE8206616.1 hypothetical protein CF335_g1757 [Tilletia laevis]KAE8249765.1 hypothetical protein A4X06_0g3077 [Tilletia controversa]
MDSTELQTYELQLEQVQTALMADPDNEELRTLEGELHNLIGMTRELLEQQEAEAAAAVNAASAGGGGRGAKGKGRQDEAGREEHGYGDSASTKVAVDPLQTGPVRQFAAGEEVSAKYSGDGRWYPARITSVSGSVHNRMYSVVFKGYNTTELLSSSDIKPTKSAPAQHTSAAQPSAASYGTSSSSNAAELPSPMQPDGTPKTRPFDPNAEKERKKRRVEKSKERHATKAVESQTKQQAWQKFAKKKSGAIAGVGGKSMFKTPDDPLAKVGVVGAGRGMTQAVGRSKHLYEGN